MHTHTHTHVRNVRQVVLFSFSSYSTTSYEID